MSDWSTLKANIAAVIKTNDNQEITGLALQTILNSIVSNVGGNASYAGLALAATNPGTPDGPVFYLAIEVGTYVNFGGISVTSVPSIIYNSGPDWGVMELNALGASPSFEIRKQGAGHATRTNARYNVDTGTTRYGVPVYISWNYYPIYLRFLDGIDWFQTVSDLQLRILVPARVKGNYKIFHTLLASDFAKMTTTGETPGYRTAAVENGFLGFLFRCTKTITQELTDGTTNIYNEPITDVAVDSDTFFTSLSKPGLLRFVPAYRNLFRATSLGNGYDTRWDIPASDSNPVGRIFHLNIGLQLYSASKSICTPVQYYKLCWFFGELTSNSETERYLPVGLSVSAV